MAGPTELTSPAIADTLVILGAAGLVIPIFARFRITPIIGFILVGLLLGPFGLGRLTQYAPWLDYLSISDPAVLAPFAEMGIILLLFSIGLELSFNRLWAMRRLVFGLGALELLVSALLVGIALVLLGNSVPTALALGLALALSSTALVLRITDTRTPVGKSALAMLLFEDIALIPIVFLLGALGRGGTASSSGELVTTLWQGALVVGVLLIAGRLLLPRLFAQAARTKSPELFLAATLLVVIGSALATAAVGLSPIVGALIAGLLIAETEYHAEVERITDPFKGLALGVFLITIGMNLDLAAVAANWIAIAIAVVAVLTIKATVTAVLLRAMGARAGTATETGILMASPSETTLIVLAAATAAQLISAEASQFWQTVTALGLIITPLLAWLGKQVGRRVDGNRHQADLALDDGPRAIVVGMGRVGRLVADMLRVHDKPFVAIDGNPDVAAAGLVDGYPVLFGDAGWDQTLRRLGLEQASAVILTMDEPVAAQRLVRKLRGQYPDLTIIARARDVSHAAQLYRAGASLAVPETLESSLQLSEAVLVDLGVPMGPVIASIHEKRDEYRAQIMEEGDLDEKPLLRSATIRERTTS